MGIKNISPLRTQQVYTIQGSLVNSSNSSSGSSGLNSIGGPVIFSTQLQQGSPDFTNNPLFRSSRQKSRQKSLNASNGYYPNVPVIITPAEANFNPASDEDSDDQVAGGYLHPNKKHSRASTTHHQHQQQHHQQQANHRPSGPHHLHLHGHQQGGHPHVTVEPVQHPLVGSGDRHLVLQVDTLPTGNRSTHDLFFAVLFLCFIGFLTYICTNVALTGKSKPEILINGYDNFGNLCGQSNVPISGVNESGKNMTNKPFLMITFARNYSLRSSCVSTCPSNEFVLSIFNRCIPKTTHAPIRIPAMLIMDVLNLSRTVIESIAADTAVCWKEVLYSSSISFIISLLSLLLLRFVAGLIIWLSIIGLCSASALGTAYVWIKWRIYNVQLASLSPLNPHHFEHSKLVERWFTASIIATILWILFVLIVIALRKRIQLAASLIKEAGKCVSCIPSLLLQPFCTCAIVTLASLAWLTGLIYLQSARVPVVDDRNGFVTFQLPDSYKVYKWPMFFAILWLFHFIVACQHFVICSSVCQWYFSRPKSDLSSPVLTSYWILTRYHLGSIALGSLIVSGIKVLRLLFKRLESLTERASNSTYTLCNSAGKVFQIFLWIFQKIILYINTNTYVEIALTGKSFAHSARRAFMVLTCNSIRVATVNSVGDFLIFLSKILIVLITLWTGAKLVEDRQSELNYVWSPLLVSGVSAFFVAHCFLSVYEMAIDSLLLCFCEEQISLERTNQLNQLNLDTRTSTDGIFIQPAKSLRQ